MVERTVSIRLQINDQEYASRLKRIENAQGKAFDEGTKKAGKQRQAMSDLSGQLGFVGAAAVAGAGVAVKSFADFDKAMSSVKATGDDARGSMDELRAAALKAGKDTAFSATEAAAGVENLLKAGVGAADVMGGGLSGALDLAAAGQIGVADAAETAATAMTQFKLSGKDVPHIADLLAAGAGKAQGEVSDMAMALKQSGLVASQFGLSIEDTTGTLAAFASAGLIGSDAGTSFKTMLLALANPAEKTMETMKGLGIAAYDAQGNFVGITNLAQQLKDKLGPLDQATRDQALAQIFGNDAIRAANVLFQQGAAGIQAWTDKVDDAGYAAETAATKMDNLSGDIEAFMGSVETALIGVGEGANGPLRDLVKQATEAVNAFGELPEGVQSATLAIVGGGGLVLLGVAGIGKLISTVSDAVSSVKDLGITSQRAGTLMDIAGKGALVVTAAALAVEVKKFSDATKEMELGGLTKDLERFGKTGKSTGELLANFGSDLEGFNAPLSDLDDSATGLGDAFWWVSRLKSDTELLGNGWNGFTDGLGQSADKIEAFLGGGDEWVKRIEEMDAGLAQMVSSGNADEATAAFDRMRVVAREQGIGMGDLLKIFPEYRSALDAVAVDQAKVADTGKDAAGGVGEIGGAAGGAVVPTETYADKLATAAEEAAALTEQADLLYDSLNLLSGTTISAEQANIAFREGIRGMSDDVTSLKDRLKEQGETYGANGKFLKENTAAGDANRLMLLDQITAAERATKATFDKTLETKSEEEALRAASVTMGQHIATLRKEAIGLGINEAAVDDYIAKQLGIPVSQVTKFTAPGLKEAIEGSQGLVDNIDDLKSKNVKQKITLDTSNIPREVLIYKSSGMGMWQGGMVHGPGSGTSDDVPIMASNGEFVSTADSTARNEAALAAGNKGATLVPVHGYRDGGIVREDLYRNTNQTVGMPTALERTGAVANAYEHLPNQVAKMVKDYFTEAAKATMSFAPGGPFPGGSSAVGTWRGKHYTHAMIARLMKAEQLAGSTMYVSQGGFRPTTSYSGTTHNRDAVDVGSPTTVRMQNALRAAGIAAWIRTPDQGPWSRHIHGVPMPGGGVQLAASAYQQTQAYLRGGDGLKGYAEGGWIDEPVSGVGMRSGARYSFAERGPEYVVPEHKLGRGNMDVQAIAAALAGARPINIPISNAMVDVDQLVREIPRAIAFAG